MALIKADLVESLQQNSGLSKSQSADIVEAILSIIKEKLISGEDVLVSGFGKFQLQDKNARKGRNPATGEDLMLRSRRIVTFKCSGKLRERVNGK